MGLFKKRVTDPEEIERLKAEIAAMGARLHASEDAKNELDTTVRGIVSRLDTSTPAPPPPPPTAAALGAPDPAELDKLNAKIERLSARIEDADTTAGTATVDPAEIQQLTARIDDLGQRLDGSDPSSFGAATIDPAEIEQLTARIDDLGRRLDDADGTAAPHPLDADDVRQLHAKLDAVTERISELDQRITAISTELANQITELSGELDAIDGSSAPADDVVDELRDAQTRLAGEQARYQIAFRQDLADLADRLKRT